jgi:hypothetical protein
VFPPAQCTPKEEIGIPITKDKMYFTIRVNEMYLAENRQWWSEYDPLVLFVAEFNYGKERATIPAVIGPNLIRRQSEADKAKHGVVLLDSRVVGPQPYRGGDVDVSVGLYQVKRASYARTLLQVMDTLSTGLGPAGEMQAVAKVGQALLQGVEGLLGLEETRYLAGERLALSTSPLDPFKSGYAALIAPPATDVGYLSIRDRRLFIQDNDKLVPYRNSDYVLFSVVGQPSRGDEGVFPFFSLKTEALKALWEGDEGVKRGKALLIAAYQQMRTSPDITATEAGLLFDDWLREFQAEQELAERTRSMPVDARNRPLSADAGELNKAVRLLAL